MKIKHWYYRYPILTLTKLTVNTFLKTKQKKGYLLQFFYYKLELQIFKMAIYAINKFLPTNKIVV